MLSEVVKKYIERSKLSYAAIAEMAELPGRTTISNWVNGYSAKPRDWRELARFCKALKLSQDETNEVLGAGGHGEISDQLAKPLLQEEDRKLLYFWEGRPNVPFQVPRLDVREFVGRTDEQTTIRMALIDGTHPCAVVGMGGVGKSLLAQQMAHQLRYHFDDGVLWARVNGEASLMDILRSWAEAYGRSDVGTYSDLDTRSRAVRELLANKKALVVIDNINNSVELNALLPPAGRCAVLVTTRNRQVMRSQPAAVVELRPLGIEDSRQLLRSYLGEQRVHEQEAGTRRLIDFVGGLPLALRVIGGTLAETKYLTLLEYADLLADERERLSYLADWEDTSKNVRACFELSYSRLASAEQHAFDRLAAFPGLDFSVSALAAVAELPLSQARFSLGRLATRSLINESHAAESLIAREGEPVAADRAVTERFEVHTLLHLFAQEKLGTRLAETQSSALTYFTSYAARYGRAHRYRWLDLEWDNLAAILRKAQAATTIMLVEATQALTAFNLGVVGFLDARGHWRTAEALLDAALENNEVDELTRASLLLKRGAFAFRLAEQEIASKRFEACRELVDTLQPGREVAWLRAYLSEFMARAERGEDAESALSWIEIGRNALASIDEPTARHFAGYLTLVESEILARTMDLLEPGLAAIEIGMAQLSDEPTAAHLTGSINRSAILARLGRLEESNTAIDSAIQMAELLGAQQRLATLLMNRGINRQKAGEISKAEEDHRAALEVARRIGDISLEGDLCINLGMAYTIRGMNDRALGVLETALTLAQRKDDPELEVYAKTTMVRPYLRQGAIDTVSQILSDSLALCRQHRLIVLMPIVLTWRGYLAYLQGDTAAGLAQVAEAIRMTKQADGMLLEEGVAFSIGGQLHDALGAYETAANSHGEALVLLQDQDRYELTLAQLAYGKHLVWRAAKMTNEAEVILSAVREALKKLEAHYDLAQLTQWQASFKPLARTDTHMGERIQDE